MCDSPIRRLVTSSNGMPAKSLSNFTFEITDQPGVDQPLFDIDATTGEIRLADPTQPNAFNEHTIWFDRRMRVPLQNQAVRFRR